MGAVYAGRVKLEEAAEPRRIDLRFDSGPEAGNVNRGIYELERGVWKLCLATRGDTRPSEFATAPGSGIALEILKRAQKEKAAGKAKAAAATASADIDSATTTELEGEWRMIDAIMNGARMDEASMQWVRRVNQGNISTVYAGPQTMLKVEFTHDRAQSPGAIDYLNLIGPNKGKRQQGIYSLKNGALSICMSAPGAARPGDFQTAKGDGRTYTVWKKA
jgi:uncharacterized protein (TIGR03067 family)